MIDCIRWSVLLRIELKNTKKGREYFMNLQPIYQDFRLKYNNKQKRMPTFLESHFKIQQLESRLSKNEYLSNECLPNFIDAQVFKALKTSEKIPKREIYPYFYHWYVLMRQFSDWTLEIWLRNNKIQSKKDRIIQEVVCVINGNNSSHSKENCMSSPQVSAIQEASLKSQNQITTNLVDTSGGKQSRAELQQSPRNYIEVPKFGSHIEKKTRSQYDIVTEYIMDIKLNSQISDGYQSIRRYFESQSVKLQSIKVISDPQDRNVGYSLRVFFLTVSYVCEQLKNKILSCSNVQTIQCKKQKRNQSK